MKLVNFLKEGTWGTRPCSYKKLPQTPTPNPLQEDGRDLEGRAGKFFVFHKGFPRPFPQITILHFS